MCGVCERIQMIRAGTNPYFVKELETGYVVIGDFQHFAGYALFIYKDHTVELFDLEPAVRSKHLEEMTIVAQAVRNAFGAEKMNYECLGNGKGGAHIHWHLFPRKAGDLGEYGNKGKGPAWWYPNGKDVCRFRKTRQRRTGKDETAITQRARCAVIRFSKAGNPGI